MNEQEQSIVGKKVLIVEDDTFLQTLLVGRLKEKKHQFFVAGDGQTALDVAKAEKPDVMVLDILLPGMSGLEVLEKIKTQEETKNIKVIMLSNIGQEPELTKAREFGAAQFLIKANTSPDEIIRTIEAV